MSKTVIERFSLRVWGEKKWELKIEAIFKLLLFLLLVLEKMLDIVNGHSQESYQMVNKHTIDEVMECIYSGYGHDRFIPDEASKQVNKAVCMSGYFWAINESGFLLSIGCFWVVYVQKSEHAPIYWIFLLFLDTFRFWLDIFCWLDILCMKIGRCLHLI